MFNQATLMGRITHDLELKTTPSGVNVCSFQIAVDRRYQQKGEERKSDFFTVVAWRQQAEFVHRYFAKGRMITVVGELQNRTYTSKDGVEVKVTERPLRSIPQTTYSSWTAWTTLRRCARIWDLHSSAPGTSGAEHPVFLSAPGVGTESRLCRERKISGGRL